MAAPRPKRVSDKSARENEALKDFNEHKHELDESETASKPLRPVPDMTTTPVTQQQVAAADIFGEDDGTGWEEGWTEIWKPMPGDVLYGVLMDISAFDKGPYDFPCFRYELVDPNGELWSFVPGGVFDQIVQDKGITVGCKLHVTFKGKRKSVGDNIMNAWGIKFKRPSGGSSTD